MRGKNEQQATRLLIVKAHGGVAQTSYCENTGQDLAGDLYVFLVFLSSVNEENCEQKMY